jgi:hypothetical protein
MELNRVAFAPGSEREHVESFFLKAVDPVHRRALWVRCTIFAGHAERYAETWAIWFDGKPRAVKNRFPIDRIRIDSERSDGFGVGESFVGGPGSRGIVRADDLVIDWDLTLDDEAPPYAPLPWPRLYESRLVTAKSATPHPSARVRGRIEIWHGRGAFTPHETIAVRDWRGMQGHNWGKRNAVRWAWCHSNAFEPGGPLWFEALTAVPGGALPGSFTLGRLVYPDRIYRFDTLRSMRAAENHIAPASWRFQLRGPDGILRGEATSAREDIVGLTYANPGAASAYCYNSKLADLVLDVTDRNGKTFTSKSNRAALEVGQPERAGDIAVVS